MSIKLLHWFSMGMILVLFGFWHPGYRASAAQLNPAPPKYTLPAAQPASVHVGGAIDTDTTWTFANSPYVVDSGITVSNGVLLTIEAGVEVRFSNGGSLIVYGALSAIGTAAQPITFTTANPTPQPGQWAGIFFKDSSDDSRDRIEHASIRYAGFAHYYRQN